MLDAPYGYLRLERDDDRALIAWMSHLIHRLDDPDIEDLAIVRIRNWFDHKWLRFSGIGRVPFESHPGVALEALSQERLTFPPFSPSRVVAETHHTREECGDEPRRLHHRRVKESSARNLQRRVSAYSQSLIVAYVSTGSEATGRASFMAYTSKGDAQDCWYASFGRGPAGWQLERVKGADRDHIATLLGVPPAPHSGVLPTS